MRIRNACVSTRKQRCVGSQSRSVAKPWFRVNHRARSARTRVNGADVAAEGKEKKERNKGDGLGAILRTGV